MELNQFSASLKFMELRKECIPCFVKGQKSLVKRLNDKFNCIRISEMQSNHLVPGYFVKSWQCKSKYAVIFMYKCCLIVPFSGFCFRRARLQI